MASEPPAHTRQPTTLVHEVYLRLVGDQDVEWANRRHFFATAAKAMRCIRIDDARKRKALKRGGDAHRTKTPIEEVLDDSGQNLIEALAIDEVLERLAQRDPRQAEIVELRYFVGLTRDETAAAMELSPRTIDKEWAFAKAWLKRELAKGDTAIQ